MVHSLRAGHYLKPGPRDPGPHHLRPGGEAAAETFHAADVDSTIDPAAETAEVMVRFAHDPRTRQIAMLDEDRFEVLDIAVRPDSRLVGRPLACSRRPPA